MGKCGFSLFLGLVALCSLVTASGAAWINVTDGSGVQVAVTESTPARIALEFTLGGIDRTDITIDGRSYSGVALPHEGRLLEKGLPELPSVARSVIIPDTRRMQLRVISSEFVDLAGVDPAPSKGNLTRAVEPAAIPYEFSPFYNTDGWYPKEQALVREPYVLRDYRGQAVVFQPLQYQPSTHTLRVYTRIDVELIDAGSGGPNIVNRGGSTIRPAAPEFARIYRNHFLNYGLEKSFSMAPEVGSMLVICYDDFAQAMQPFVDWKNHMGLPTTMVLSSQVGNKPADYKGYIQAAYDASADPRLTFVLLVGDAAQIPAPQSDGGAADPTYAKVAGNDDYPDIFVGRFSAENVDQVATQVQRSVDYEKSPLLAGSAWYPQGTGIGSQYGVGDDNEYDWQHISNIRSQFLDYGYTRIDRFYGASANAWRLVDSLNAGRSVVNYCGHGSENGWGTTGFNSYYIPYLHNDHMLPFIFSVACLNGQFDSGTCFAENWLRATHNGNPSGAVAAYMSSINQSWSPPMEAQDEFAQLLSTDGARTFGSLCYNGSCSMIDQYGSDGVSMFNTWHIFGDPSLRVRTKQPEPLVLDVPMCVSDSDTTLELDVVGATEALCGVTRHGQYLGSAFTNSSGHASVPFLTMPSIGDTLELTVSEYNRIPSTATILVLQPGLPTFSAHPAEYRVILGADTTSTDSLWVSNQGKDGSVLYFVASFATAADSAFARITPAQGLVAEGESLRVTISFKTRGLSMGEYSGEILINYNPNHRVSIPVTMQVTAESDVADGAAAPAWDLRNAGPNPARGLSILRYALPEGAATRVAVYDLSGRMVRLLQEGFSSPGGHEVAWDGRDAGGRTLPAGVYFTRLSTPQRSLSTRVLRLR
jgi:hypothetical protein